MGWRGRHDGKRDDLRVMVTVTVMGLGEVSEVREA